MTTKLRARDRNPLLGRAMDLFHAWGVWFYNDPMTPWLPAGEKRPVYGRSLKPICGLTAHQHRTIAALATRVYRTPQIKSPNRQHHAVGGEIRYHFSLRFGPMERRILADRVSRMDKMEFALHRAMKFKEGAK